MKKKGNIIVVSAPSGAGKSTITRMVLAAMPEIVFSVSHTTRPPRKGEIDGKDYFFVNRETFRAMIERSEFLEWAEYVGNLYGTSLSFIRRILDEGRDVLLDIETQGAGNIKNLHPDAVLIFILPPSYPELFNRLEGRGLDAEDIIRRRLNKARHELQAYPIFDYTLINEDADTCAAEACAIIRTARLRTANNLERIRTIFETFGESHV